MTRAVSQPAQQTQQIVQHETLSQGPLPVASEFYEYNKALPGASDRILAMAEKEANERHANTRILVKSQSFQDYVGPVAGFVIAFTGMYFAYDLSKRGIDTMGYAALAVSAFSMIGSFASSFKKKQR